MTGPVVQAKGFPKDPWHCPDMDACTQWVSSLGLRQDLTYHPRQQLLAPAMD
jgi:hypothetical protein